MAHYSQGGVPLQYPKKMSETRFHKYFIENPGKTTGYKTEIINSEFCLYNANHIVSSAFNALIPTHPPKCVIGKIDVIFRHRGSVYVAEIKNIPNGKRQSSLWEATKILAYAKYLEFQLGKKKLMGKKYKPAIIIPQKEATTEARIVTGSLGITLFGYKKLGDSYKMEEIKFA